MSEKIEDILKELRSKGESSLGGMVLVDANAYADRIEVAVAENATTTSTCDKSSQVGNAAEMREVLDEIRVAAMSDYEPDADYLIEKCNAALSAPPRNCDVFEVHRIDDEFEKAMGFPPSKTADERDELMRENWFLFKVWLFDEAKGENDGN